MYNIMYLKVSNWYTNAI